MFLCFFISALKPVSRSVSAPAPEAPRMYRTLPLYFIAFASAAAPTRPYSTWSFATSVVFGAVIALSTAITLMPASVASLIAALFAAGSPELTMIAFIP